MDDPCTPVRSVADQKGSGEGPVNKAKAFVLLQETKSLLASAKMKSEATFVRTTSSTEILAHGAQEGKTLQYSKVKSNAHDHLSAFLDSSSSESVCMPRSLSFLRKFDRKLCPQLFDILSLS